MPLALSRVLFVVFFLCICFAEILRVYFVMPFPGSQQTDTIQLAYRIEANITWIRWLALLVAGSVSIRVFKKGRTWEKTGMVFAWVTYIVLLVLFNERLPADKIFYQPGNRAFLPIAQTAEKNKLVIGVVLNGEAKAYPIQLIGYHHQVVDTVGNQPLIITYCTVCRTGRAYSTLVNGRHESFRLVGMDHFNAVFEDNTTKTWWQQANGLAIAGPLKGQHLTEIASEQMTAEAWMRRHPNSLVMAPDSLYEERYFRLEDYDRGTMQSELVKRNRQSWQPKSWIVGVKNDNTAMAYDWNELVKKRMIQDSVRALPILLAMEADTVSFHVYDRRLKGTVLQFSEDIADEQFSDINTHSTWNMDGVCIAGPLKGERLRPVQAYNEFWHSWENFQPNAKKFLPAP